MKFLCLSLILLSCFSCRKDITEHPIICNYDIDHSGTYIGDFYIIENHQYDLPEYHDTLAVFLDTIHVKQECDFMTLVHESSHIFYWFDSTSFYLRDTGYYSDITNPFEDEYEPGPSVFNQYSTWLFQNDSLIEKRIGYFMYPIDTPYPYDHPIGELSFYGKRVP